MYIVEQVYEGGTLSKTTNRAEYDHAINVSKLKEGESASLTNPDKV